MMKRTRSNLVIRGVAADTVTEELGYDDDGWERLDVLIPKGTKPLNFVLTIKIGPSGERSMDLFYLSIRSRTETESKDSDWKPQYTLYVDEFDWLKIKKEILLRFKSCVADSMEETYKLLRQKFYWEFEKTPARKKKPPKLDASAFFPRTRPN